VRIIGGENAEITEFPYMVAFRYIEDNHLFCGGAIVSRWNILTSAHCLFREQSTFSRIRIYTGVSRTTDISGPTHEIDHIDFHPLFTGRKCQDEMNLYDIAVVTVG
jgi:secreted trypsin-like serine protease